MKAELMKRAENETVRLDALEKGEVLVVTDSYHADFPVGAIVMRVYTAIEDKYPFLVFSNPTTRYGNAASIEAIRGRRLNRGEQFVVTV